jgi:hypothetical protein
MLLPPNLEDLIPEDHLIQVVNEMIDEIEMDLSSSNIKVGAQAHIIRRCC